jgi:hydrogenase maturation protein HypF
MEVTGLRIHITGIVQGVGFRPFIFGLAERLDLKGWVRNTSAGVDIEIDGSSQALDRFKNALVDELPPLAMIYDIEIQPRPSNGFSSFEIIQSESIPDAFQPISPDVSICPDCLRELFDPADRRYRYPFINCTNCGPRLTIIQDIPYDRPNTTMSGFTLCSDCAREYSDPLDRRFHAQPVACPACGPQVWLESVNKEDARVGRPSPKVRQDAAIHAVQEHLINGRIVAIKGLGGFHLACDALNIQAVSELRKRKLRVDKPFALMMLDIDTVRKHCIVSEEEQALLESRQRPIAILKRRTGSEISEQVAPRQDTWGVMLPYTPLHYLLFAQRDSLTSADDSFRSAAPTPSVLVMTSGNLSEEPIAYKNSDARTRLSSLADAFLMHDRDIHTRCDDSVVRMVALPGKSTGSGDFSHPAQIPVQLNLQPLRRSRGYAPYPVRLLWDSPHLLATGSELKNTFCLARENYAFLSHHIGDMENYETLLAFEQGVEFYKQLFRVSPSAVAYDLHPNYLATRYALTRAEEENIIAIGVQHHHAHIAACMAEHRLSGETPVIGVAFDGTGYGEDGAIWGGEFLIADYRGYQRAAHLAYVPLPGGDASVRKPSRTALSYLWQLGLDWDTCLAPVQVICDEERTALRSQLELKLNSPLTSSMGRLFDAVAALAGVRQQVNYEAQAAIEFESLIDPSESGIYPFDISGSADHRIDTLGETTSTTGELIISPHLLFEALLANIYSGRSLPTISARFHNGVAQMVLEVCLRLRSSFGIDAVVLSGGVWQNTALLTRTCGLLQQAGFRLYTHGQVPPNDGGISLGQAAVAAHRLR